MDAIDVALVRFDDQNTNIHAYEQFPIPKTIQEQIREINVDSSLGVISKLDAVLGELFAVATQKLLDTYGINAGDVCAIGSHGQTILHLPEDTTPRTLQIGDANIIAYKTGITTVADFRRMDIAAGGQGAPLASAFHAWHFREQDRDRLVLNIGGMANVTVLPADQEQAVLGFDTGPGNALMDDWIQNHLGKDFDKDGDWAASGTTNTELLESLLESSYFATEPPKSTGKDDFNLAWLNQHIEKQNQSVSMVDVQSTLLELSARTISQAINKWAAKTEEILICGGGIHNTQMVSRLNELLLNKEISSTAKFGIDPDALEAVVFAWLAKCRMDNIPANFPSVTGADNAVKLGGIYKA